MYFYRDSDGNEVDLLLPTGGQLHAIEIKAGATVNPDYFKGLKTFAAHNPTRWPVAVWCMAARKSQSRSDWNVHSWLDLQYHPLDAS